MALQYTSVGAFTSVYIGQYGSASPLPLMKSTRTNGSGFTESLPTEYVEGLGVEVQNDNYSISLDLSFYGTADEVYTLARGLAVGSTGSARNNPMGINYYQILVVGPDIFYFPKVKAVGSSKYQNSKTSPVITTINFKHEQRSVIPPLVLKALSTSEIVNYMPAGTSPF